MEEISILSSFSKRIESMLMRKKKLADNNTVAAYVSDTDPNTIHAEDGKTITVEKYGTGLYVSSKEPAFLSGGKEKSEQKEESGTMLKTPEGMKALADDPQYVLDNSVNGRCKEGKKYVVSKRKTLS